MPHPTTKLSATLSFSLVLGLAARAPSDQPAAAPACPTADQTAAERYLPRIAVGKGEPCARFVVQPTGAPFFVKGFNYIRLRHTHATFDAATQATAAYYDAQRAESMLTLLERYGYNTVRVFICGRHSGDPGIAGDYDQTSGLYEPYLENFLDFLQRARRHGVYVLPTFGDGELPRNAYYRAKASGLPLGQNAIYLTQQGIAAKVEYVTGVLRFVHRHDPRLLTTLLGVQCQNELYLRSDQWPFQAREGKVTLADGSVCDLAVAAERQALMAHGLRQYHAALVQAVKEMDRELLVGEGLFTLRAVGKSIETHAAIWPGASGDARFPPTLLSLGEGSLDFLDIHFYRTRAEESVADAFRKDMHSSLWDDPGMQPVRAEKPVIVGEFGAFRGAERDFAQAKTHLLQIRDLIIQEGFAGMLYWTFDTFEQKELFPAMEGGEEFLRELAAVKP